MSTDPYPNLFVYQYPPEAFEWGRKDVRIVGRLYSSTGIILDWGWADDETLRFLMVEEEGEEQPFVIFTAHIDALDVRLTEEREETIRYALILWEA